MTVRTEIITYQGDTIGFKSVTGEVMAYKPTAIDHNYQVGVYDQDTNVR